MENLLTDPRFAHIKKDPKFRRVPKAERKVKIDKRFQSMFKDKKFTLKYTVDKRGRPVNQTSVENLKKYYALSDTEDEVETEKDDLEETRKKQEKQTVKQLAEKEENEEDEEDEGDEAGDEEGKEENDDDNNCFSSNGDLLRVKPQSEHDSEPESSKESWDTDTEQTDQKEIKKELDENEKQLLIKKEGGKLSNEIRQKLRDLTVDYARGEGVLVTDSSSDEESSTESEEEDDIEHNWGELDKEAETTDEITHRLAVCNMDWDRIRAVDLMVLFNSFLPGSGVIRSVTIYPSEFGLQRMKEEEVKGPIELVESKRDKNNLDDDSEENEEGSKYHMEKLRQYQLNRLKYYYAVVDCDTAETANKIYTDCDGVEYESTATKIDLRFIPDDMTFDQEPKEVCKEIPQLSKYQPRQFTTTALQQVKVNLTWDETNPERQEITQKLSSGKIDEVDETDIQAYLASGSSDDEAENEDENKFEENEAESDSESKQDPITKYKSLLKSIEEQENAKKQKDVELEFTWGLGTVEKAQKLVNERLKKKENLTPFEQYIEKRKAKKKAKREERKKLKEENNQSESEDDIPSDVDLSDPYFADLKKAKSKKKKPTSKQDNDMSSTEEDKEKQQKAELELLLMDKNDEDKQHFNMKKIEEQSTLSKSKKKRLMKKKKDLREEPKEDNFEVNVQDPRFAALFTSHHFNIDPADPHYRKTKGTEILVQEKLKRRADDDTVNEVQPKQAKTEKKMNIELQSLVKSVKKNVQNISQPIKR